jgi:hypothetical protein
VRKAYIVQYAPDGAEVILADARSGSERAPANAPGRQFSVLTDGVQVA